MSVPGRRPRTRRDIARGDDLTAGAPISLVQSVIAGGLVLVTVVASTVVGQAR